MKFNHWQTGGGCTAYGAEDAAYEYLITDGYASAPKQGERCMLFVQDVESCETVFVADLGEYGSLITPYKASGIIIEWKRAGAKVQTFEEQEKVYAACEID